ncbi:hypothetical protein K1719_018787 [Acacia pycnantha]|nr:hypothetical protein K1719_018787 [Acacia pycnantha]
MMVITPIIVWPLVSLVRALMSEPIGSLTTMLYSGNLLPRNLNNLDRFVRPELLHPHNYFFHLIVSFLKFFW